MKPVLQIALDFVILKRALQVAREAVEGGADWIEAGTPLIKSEGLDAVRALKAEFPRHKIIADMKTMDAGRVEMETAAKAGAAAAMVMGVSSDSTIKECIEAGRNYGLEIGVDFLGVTDHVEHARRVAGWGADFISVHCPIDDQMRALDPFEKLARIAEAVDIPVAVAGGINSETASRAVQAGASIVVVGGAITKAEDARQATATIKRAIETGEVVATKLFKRTADVRDLLMKVSSANLSDAMHRRGDLKEMQPVLHEERKFVGPAVTCRACPGDWAKPVEAIEHCREGDVLVIETGGLGPAVWGELATESAVQRRLSGVVVYGAIRDIPDIRALGFPCWCKLMTPTAGEPKGFGEINVPIKIVDAVVEPGDWIVADGSGIVRVPKDKAVEIANRAMDVLETENRLRREIRNASTLSEVAELLRWEKK